MAISKDGDIYSWGEGFHGKLGQGINNDTRQCVNMMFPKKVRGIVTKDMLNSEQVFLSGAGKQINIVLNSNGQLYQWGKANYHAVSLDFEKFTRPRKLLRDVKV